MHKDINIKNLIKAFILLLFIGELSFAKESKLEKIRKDNKLEVCIWTQYYGISYLDKRTQKLVGIDSDLAIELAKDLDVNIEFVESSFPTLIKDITNNRCDIAMFAIGNTESRRAKVRFTSPHLESDIYAITSNTNEKIKSWDDIDKKDIIVAVSKGTYHEPVMKKKLKNAKLLIVKGFKQREDEVQSGRADVFMTDYPYAKKMLAKTNWAKLIVPKKTYHLTPYSWVIAYGDNEFYERVEKFIKEIKEDGRLLLMAKNNDLIPIAKLE